jgi:hypothetical protein
MLTIHLHSVPRSRILGSLVCNSLYYCMESLDMRKTSLCQISYCSSKSGDHNSSLFHVIYLIWFLLYRTIGCFQSLRKWEFSSRKMFMASIQDFICFLKVCKDICLTEGLPVLEIGLNCWVTHLLQIIPINYEHCFIPQVQESCTDDHILGLYRYRWNPRNV